MTETTVLHGEYEIINNVKVIPNPVDVSENNVIRFRYNTVAGTYVRVKVYNLAGELIKVLESYNGMGEVEWDVNKGEEPVSAGLYVTVIYARTDTGMEKRLIRKFVIMR